jgi:ABC-type antimicrobial peptide transport system permease subunit
MIAASAAVIFAKFAQIQDLNPFLWGALALVIYAGAPAFMIWRGASIFDAPLVWLSSFGGLAVLFIAQSIVAYRARRRRR